MNHEHINDPLSDIFLEIFNEMKSISEQRDVYSKKISNHSVISFSVKKEDKKVLAMAYYQYASLLVASVSRMETLLSKLPNIIVEADKRNDREQIVLCDELLTRYGEFKKSISTFAEQNERLFSKDHILSSEMLTPLSEFNYKLSYFESYLKEHQN